MEAIFKEGDFILHNDPYEGEGEYMVIAVNHKRQEYSCGFMPGKYNKEIDLKNNIIFAFETAHRSYKKVG